MSFGKFIKYFLTFVSAGIGAVMMVNTVTENVERNIEEKNNENEDEK